MVLIPTAVGGDYRPRVAGVSPLKYSEKRSWPFLGEMHRRRVRTAHQPQAPIIMHQNGAYDAPCDNLVPHLAASLLTYRQAGDSGGQTQAGKHSDGFTLCSDFQICGYMTTCLPRRPGYSRGNTLSHVTHVDLS